MSKEKTSDLKQEILKSFFTLTPERQEKFLEFLRTLDNTSHDDEFQGVHE